MAFKRVPERTDLEPTLKQVCVTDLKPFMNWESGCFYPSFELPFDGFGETPKCKTQQHPKDGQRPELLMPNWFPPLRLNGWACMQALCDRLHEYSKMSSAQTDVLVISPDELCQFEKRVENLMVSVQKTCNTHAQLTKEAKQCRKLQKDALKAFRWARQSLQEGKEEEENGTLRWFGIEGSCGVEQDPVLSRNVLEACVQEFIERERALKHPDYLNERSEMSGINR